MRKSVNLYCIMRFFSAETGIQKNTGMINGDKMLIIGTKNSVRNENI